MPPVWTAERDQRLLLLLINNVNVKAEDLAKEYPKAFGSVDNYEPTARAIQEHFVSLRKQAGAPGNKGAKSSPAKNSPAKSLPKKVWTPKKTITPRKTTTAAPTSASKRKRAHMSDDEMEDADDTDVDHAAIKSEVVTPRKRLDRRSKSIGSGAVNRYTEESEEENGGDADGTNEATKDTTTDIAEANIGTEMPQSLPEGMSAATFAANAGRRKMRPAEDLTDYSDTDNGYDTGLMW